MANKIFYTFKRSGPLVYVFLHGFGGDSAVWQYMAKPIIKGGDSFLAIDLLGHGLSPRPKQPVVMDRFVEGVKNIIDKEKIKEIVLVGHCFGGMVGLELALRYPGLAKKLILICTYYKTPGWLQLLSVLYPLTKFLIPPLGGISALGASNFSSKAKHIDWDKYKKTSDISPRRLIFADLKHVGLSSYIAIIKGINGWNRKDDIKKISQPVLVIAGKKDLLFSLNKEKEFASLFKNAKLEVINAGHIAPLNRAEEVKKLILEF